MVVGDMGRPVPRNNTKRVEGEDSVLGKISGRSDAVFLRNKYQTELDNAHAAIVNHVHYLEDKMKELKGAFDNAQRLKKNIEAHLEERKTLYENLENLLANEKGHEKEMWFETLKSRIQEMKDKNITVFPKIKDSDVESMNVGSTLDHPKQYPDSKIKDRYEKILNDIEGKEREIRKERESYNGAVSSYNYFLTPFEKNIQKADDKFVAYDKIFQEGTKRLNDCRYSASIFHKFSSEKAKDEISLDTLSHRAEQFRNTLDIIKRNLSQYETKKFVEMQY
jgi:hypothetical protein